YCIEILSHPLSNAAAKLSVAADGITISTDENYHSYEVTERLKHPSKGVTRCVAVVLLWLFGDFQTCCLTQERYSLVSPFEFFDGKACVGHVTAGVHEGNHFCRIPLEGILGKLIAMVHQSSQVLEQRNFLANLLKFCRTRMADIANDIGGSFGLNASTVV